MAADSIIPKIKENQTRDYIATIEYTIYDNPVEFAEEVSLRQRNYFLKKAAIKFIIGAVCSLVAICLIIPLFCFLKKKYFGP
jgi:hypothetical protein